jgi:hypothetical protein
MDKGKPKVAKLSTDHTIVRKLLMPQKLLKTLAASIIVVVVFGAIAFASIGLDWSSKDTLRNSIAYWINRPAIIDHRNYIFCNILKPGMDKKTVLNALQQFGEFAYSEANWGVNSDLGYSEISGNYIDNRIAGRNTIILSFQDGNYVGASMIVFLDYTKAICKND